MSSDCVYAGSQVYCPYYLLSKKRYAAKMWVKENNKMKMDKVRQRSRHTDGTAFHSSETQIDVKGMQHARRDSIPFLRDTASELLDIILETPNAAGAIDLAKKRAVELLDGRVPVEKLMLSQKVRTLRSPAPVSYAKLRLRRLTKSCRSWRTTTKRDHRRRRTRDSGRCSRPSDFQNRNRKNPW